MIRSIDLLERPVRLRLPFRFGVVTLTECPQAFAVVRIELANGRGATGCAAEMMAPKWFDKSLDLTNEDNFEQLRVVLGLARDAYLGDRTPATAFGHFARHYDEQQRAAGTLGFNPLLANYGPALIDRAVLDAVCRAHALSFYTAMRANLPGLGSDHPAFANFDFMAFLSALRPATSIAARHTVGLVDAIGREDLSTPVNDGLPETLEDVVTRYGHHHFKLKLGGKVDADIARLCAIATVLERHAPSYVATLDGNEQYGNQDQLTELLARMKEIPALATMLSRIAFIEQPIHRDAALVADFRNNRLDVPLLIDELDSNLDTFIEFSRARLHRDFEQNLQGVVQVLSERRAVCRLE